MTDDRGALRVLAAASTALVSDTNPADVLARLMADCLEPLSALSAAILVVDAHDRLALLSSSSHRATEIELLQTQQDRGPCVDAISLGREVSALGAEEMERRWGEVGTAIQRAGFDGVRAFPLRWHGETLGGFNVFHPADADAEGIDTVGQVFADVATLVLVQALDVSREEIAARIERAIVDRAAVERAKGVLAYLHDLDMEAAFEHLVRRADEEGADLTETALRVIAEQVRTT